MKSYLSATAFARLIQRDPKTVIAWVEKGLIPNVKRVGKIYQIPHEEVEKAKTLNKYPTEETWPV